MKKIIISAWLAGFISCAAFAADMSALMEAERNIQRSEAQRKASSRIGSDGRTSVEAVVDAMTQPTAYDRFLYAYLLTNRTDQIAWTPGDFVLLKEQHRLCLSVRSQAQLYIKQYEAMIQSLSGDWAEVDARRRPLRDEISNLEGQRDRACRGVDQLQRLAEKVQGSRPVDKPDDVLFDR